MSSKVTAEDVRAAIKKGSSADRKKMSKTEWRIRNYPFTCLMLGLIIVLGALASASFYENVNDGYQFNQKIGGYLNYAASANTFGQISLNLNRAEVGINATFLGNQTTTYNSPFYWDHYYSHSVTAYVAYLKSIQARIVTYNATYADMIHNSSSVIQTQDWYQSNINTLQGLISNDGAVYSGLQNQYFMNVAGSLAYWTSYFLFPLIFFGVFIWFAVFIEDNNADYYSGYRD